MVSSINNAIAVTSSGIYVNKNNRIQEYDEIYLVRI